MTGQATLFGPPTDPPARRKSARDAGPKAAHPLLDLPAALGPFASHLFLGTSSWSFPGWAGIVYGEAASEQRLARDGLRAYARHGLLSAVGLDRSFYAPLPVGVYAQYASQVPEGFSFVVKAPASVTDAVIRDAAGRGRAPNPLHLDPHVAQEQFITPCLHGLGAAAGVLVFQFSPLPAETRDAPRAWTERLGRFLSALPRSVAVGGKALSPNYAVELRDATLITPRLIHTLQDADAHYCVALHDRMPPAHRQFAALDAFARRGPLIVRWTLSPGLTYEAAREAWAPFDRLQHEDAATRKALAARAMLHLRDGESVWIIANNKAEGCAPLSLVRLADSMVQVAAA